jgi:CDGSH-type Zn-finger protein
MNSDSGDPTTASQEEHAVSVVIHEGGPYEVVGSTIKGQAARISTNANGTSVSYDYSDERELKAGDRLCRCGDSANKPFCDGSHQHTRADLSLAASEDPYSSDPAVQVGPVYTLLDDESLCSYARFCDAGERVWTEVTLEGSKHVELVKSIVRNCPGGRLVVTDSATGEVQELVGQRGVSFIEDPVVGVNGPIMLVGGIPVKNYSGVTYQVRSNQALCRCGRSSNKPFCDGSHAATS